MSKRLNDKYYSKYNLNSHLKDYKKAQYYKKNHCRYPSIDFYRTNKISKSCVYIFNFSSISNMSKRNKYKLK